MMIWWAPVFAVVAVVFIALFVWSWVTRPSGDCSNQATFEREMTLPAAVTNAPCPACPEAPAVTPFVPPALAESRSYLDWDEFWISQTFKPREEIPLRDRSSKRRIPCDTLFAVSVYLANTEQAEIVEQNLRNIHQLYPDAVICVVDNGSPIKYAYDEAVVDFIDNREWVQKGFGFEFSGYLTALQRYDPQWAVCMQGSMVLSKRFEFTDLEKLQPISTKQIFAIKYFPSLLLHGEDAQFISHASLMFGSVPRTRALCNGVFGTSFVAAKPVLENLKEGLLRLQVSTKLRSQATERIVAIYMWNIGVDAAMQNLDGDFRYQSEYTPDNHPGYFWKVFFTQAQLPNLKALEIQDENSQDKTKASLTHGRTTFVVRH